MHIHQAQFIAPLSSHIVGVVFNHDYIVGVVFNHDYIVGVVFNHDYIVGVVYNPINAISAFGFEGH